MSFTPIKPPILSQFHGQVVADKQNESRDINVYSPEFLPFVKGEIRATQQESSYNVSGGNGGSVQTQNFIKATYKDEQANRPAPPDVRKGENVIFYNEGDDKTWYWKSEGRNDNLRRTETVRMDAGGTTEYTPKKTDDNSYFFELDSRRNKRVRLSTSKANGEKDRYIFDIDTGNGAVTLGDASGNQLFVNTGGGFVGMKNAKGSQIHMDGSSICLACEGDFRVRAKGAISFESSKNMLIHTLMGLKIIVMQNMQVTCAQRIQVTAAQQYDLTSPVVKLRYTGNFYATGGDTTFAVTHFSVV